MGNESELTRLEHELKAAEAAYNVEHWSFGRSSTLTPSMTSMQRLWDASGQMHKARKALMDFKRSIRAYAQGNGQ